MAKNTRSDEPAFPKLAYIDMKEGRGKGDAVYESSGMTMREWLTGQALTGLAAAITPDVTANELAELAVKSADAVLERLSK